MTERRRASDHPWETRVRLGLGVLFAAAGLVLGYLELHIPMSASFVMCGAMMKIPVGRILPR